MLSQTNSIIPPKLRLAYENFKVVSEFETYKVFEANPRSSGKEKHMIRVLDLNNQSLEEASSFDCMATLFVQEILHLEHLQPGSVLVDTFEMNKQTLGCATLPFIPFSSLSSSEELSNAELMETFISDMVSEIEFLWLHKQFRQIMPCLGPESIYMTAGPSFFLNNWSKIILRNSGSTQHEVGKQELISTLATTAVETISNEVTSQHLADEINALAFTVLKLMKIDSTEFDTLRAIPTLTTSTYNFLLSKTLEQLQFKNDDSQSVKSKIGKMLVQNAIDLPTLDELKKVTAHRKEIMKEIQGEMKIEQFEEDKSILRKKKSSRITKSSNTLPTQKEFVERHKDLSNQDTYLICYDIIPEDLPTRQEVAEKLASGKFLNFKESKAIAAFISAAVGDALGSLLEGRELSYTRRDVDGFESLKKLLKSDSSKNSIGKLTDDTCGALCIADSLIENELKFVPKDLRIRFISWWLAGYNNCFHNVKNKADAFSTGVGNTTLKGFEEFLKNNSERVPEVKGLKEQDTGNGSIIRLVPIVIAFHTNPEKGVQYAHDQSFTTHNSEESAECARFLVHCAIKLFNSESPKEGRNLLNNIHEGFSSPIDSVNKLARSEQEKFNPEIHNSRHNAADEDRNWNWRDKNWKFSPQRTKRNKNLIGIYSMDAACMSLHILYNTSSSKEAMLKAVNLGGDADSIGTIIGMLGGCLYGIDETLLGWYQKYVVQWDDQRVAIRAQVLYQLAVE